MGTGYTRNDTPNNIADGNVINASDLDGEFDAIQTAFNGSTGHSHDGTTGEGPQIATAGLADNAVTTAKITDANVTLAKMAANSVDSDQYVDGSIDRVHLAADIVDGTKIADDSIDSEHYVDGSIDTAHIANDAVTGDKLANNIQIAGTLGVTGVSSFADGSNSAPSLTFTSDTNTGIYRGGTDILKFVTAGTDRLTIDASGVITSEVNGAVRNLDLDNEADTPYMTFSESGAVNFFIGESSIVGGGGVGFYDLYATSGLGQRFFTNALKRMQIESNGDISFYEDTGTTPKLFWDASEERLGIGTSSPDYLTQIEDTSGDADLSIKAGTSSYAQILLGDVNNPAIGRLRYNNADNSFQTVVNGGIATTIDSSGNLLVGKTSLNTAVDGVELRGGGQLAVTKDGSWVGNFNRKTSDGDIVSFQKDGTTVGSIGTVDAGYLYIASPRTTDAGIKIGTSRIVPSTTTGADRDGAIDLGYSSGRWKDLYLSGGVYLGGTGSANLLDDYEEGTWTPTLEVNNSTTGITYASRSGSYTKVGRKVTLLCDVTLSNKGSNTGAVNISNFPFTSGDNLSSTSFNGTGFAVIWENLNTATSSITSWVSQSGITANLWRSIGSGSTSMVKLTDANLTNITSFRFIFMYETA